MTTIIYQSDMRASDPVGGCYNIIHQLQSQIHFANAELQLVLQRLAFFRSQPHHHIIIINTTTTTTNNNNSVPFLHQHPQFQHVNNSYNYYNSSFQDDLNFLARQNSMSLLEDDISQDPVLLDQDYHQNPVLEFMDSTLHPHHSDDESVLLKVDKAVL
ncbi:hypothetical protein Fmac_019855 [Flemingia macrophylla]|uniref:LOB domain-containing protein n=1 Tax=Flemingia macrophylla TaxID=520843 RepID=A0ABD1M904_9FABA